MKTIKPKAKLVRVAEKIHRRKRWSPDEHKKWIKKVYGNKTFPSSDAALARARADRWEKEAAIPSMSSASSAAPSILLSPNRQLSINNRPSTINWLSSPVPTRGTKPA